MKDSTNRIHVPAVPPEYLGKCHVWLIPSKSRPGWKHALIMGEHETVCTCEGAMFTGACIHLQSIRHLQYEAAKEDRS